jgi:hypothetical protein
MPSWMIPPNANMRNDIGLNGDVVPLAGRFGNSVICLEVPWRFLK